jgi:uncharacterized membrane protein
MLLPLLFLPLLAPDAALPALPILAMNLLTNRPFQYTVREQYQTLVIPGLIIATIIGVGRIWRWWERMSEQSGTNQTRVARRFVVLRQHLNGSLFQHPLLAVVSIVLLATIITNLAYRNPVVTTLLYRDDPARIAAMRELAAMVPADASLAATSFLAPNMMPRRQIYYFPNSPSFPPLERAEYIFIDTRAAALDTDLGRTAMAKLQDTTQWHLLTAKQDLMLYRRVEP